VSSSRLISSSSTTSRRIGVDRVMVGQKSIKQFVRVPPGGLHIEAVNALE
jgi:hypothetical protein